MTSSAAADDCICADGPPPDDDVLRRVMRRTRQGMITSAALAVVVASGAWVWPGTVTTAAGRAVAVAFIALLLLSIPVLASRVTLLGRAAVRMHEWCHTITTMRDWQTALEDGDWDRGICGAPLPLHKQTGPSLLRRRRKTPPMVAPIRTQRGPLARGRAVVVHGRADGRMLADGDYVMVLALSRRGPFVVARPADGALFVGDRWSIATP